MSDSPAANDRYSTSEPARAEIDALKGPAVIEFGTDWCGYCNSIQPMVKPLLAKHSRLTHLKIEDGPGRPLGRSFGIKSWPTFIFLRDGRELARLVRPGNPASVEEALGKIDPLN